MRLCTDDANLQRHTPTDACRSLPKRALPRARTILFTLRIRLSAALSHRYFIGKPRRYDGRARTEGDLLAAYHFVSRLETVASVPQIVLLGLFVTETIYDDA